MVALTACSPEDSSSAAEAPSSLTSATPTTCDGPQAPAYGGAPAAYESQARVEEGQAVGAEVGAPVLSSKPSGVKGWSLVQVPVRAEVVTNGIFAVGPDSFALVDPSGKQCARPRTNPLPGALTATEIDEKRGSRGSIAFLVPDGAVLSKYKVIHHGPDQTKADAAWSATGKRIATPAATTCSTDRSPFRLAEGGRWGSFGEWTTFGDPSTVGSRVWVGMPTTRTLKPSDRHPNDVVGVVVPIQVQAYGSVAFVDRNMFQLVEGKGSLCRYSQIGTEGETLSSSLVQPGTARSFSIIFWVPKGAKLKDWRLFYRHDTGSTTADSVWGMPKKG
ncbi:hypothetical protein VV01_05035 [Luteipulveratus halotolerans]|uniref:Uncharacterized protein n=1 Tax=Luteipulveratus halotolerans TaxID=1631356 RepID=A0A0L6CFT2_9MICO|nr:hypothetical protein VV01_05035 [Luteipulveratus halotolerans]